MSDQFTVGQFRSPPGNGPRSGTQTPTPPAAPAAKPEEVPQNQAPTVPEEKTPVELYRERLKAAKIPLEEALSIVDSVLKNGYYEERHTLREQVAVFRTRQYADTMRLHGAVELHNPRTQTAYDDLLVRHNLAASLYEWGGKKIPHNDEADAEAAMEWVKKLPQPTFMLLTMALSKFDNKIYTVFSEGSTDAF